MCQPSGWELLQWWWLYTWWVDWSWPCSCHHCCYGWRWLVRWYSPQTSNSTNPRSAITLYNHRISQKPPPHSISVITSTCCGNLTSNISTRSWSKVISGIHPQCRIALHPCIISHSDLKYSGKWRKGCSYNHLGKIVAFISISSPVSTISGSGNNLFSSSFHLSFHLSFPISCLSSTTFSITSFTISFPPFSS